MSAATYTGEWRLEPGPEPTLVCPFCERVSKLPLYIAESTDAAQCRGCYRTLACPTALEVADARRGS